ncbi:MAG: ABC transporter permease subunit [Clostridia bacterium]|nr:ABC transporter permease subunit [Clostridia bacterium]
MKMKKREVAKKCAQWILVAVVWLAIWQAAHEIIDKSILLPSPAETFGRLWEIAGTAELWQAVAGTVLRILAGFAGGMVIGSLMAAFTYRSPMLRKLFHPLLVITKTTPVASFIILALVLLPTGIVPSFTVMLIVTPVFWSNVFGGANAVDGNLLEMAQMFDFGASQRIRRIYIPSLMPYFRSAVTSGIGLAWKSGIAAEVICVSRDSIGSNLYESKIYLETDNLFAWTAVVIIISIVIERAVVAAVNAAFGDRRSAR